MREPMSRPEAYLWWLPLALAFLLAGCGAPKAPTASPTLGSGAPALQAWRWQGESGTPLDPPSGTRLHGRPARVEADLRGDGVPLWASLDAQGRVEVRDGEAPDAPLRWSNEEPAWRITRIEPGDPNDDGRTELLLLLWKPNQAGQLKSHPFLMGWRGGRYRIIWGGSATDTPIQDLASADLDGDGRQELVVLEGGQQPGDAGDHVAVLHWHEWGFAYVWRSQLGRWSGLALSDLTGDGLPEILVTPSSYSP